MLVATPPLTDPNFARAVVLVLEHSEEGALGLILNRPSTVAVSQALPAWEPLASSPAVMFLGGPVQPDGVIALARAGRQPADGYRPVLPEIGVIDLAAGPLLAAELASVRMFAGYAGWGNGQLEAEIDAGGWFVVAAAAEDVFTDEPQRLWRAVLQRQGGVFTTISEDPSSN